MLGLALLACSRVASEHTAFLGVGRRTSLTVLGSAADGLAPLEEVVLTEAGAARSETPAGFFAKGTAVPSCTPDAVQQAPMRTKQTLASCFLSAPQLERCRLGQVADRFKRSLLVLRPARGYSTPPFAAGDR